MYNKALFSSQAHCHQKPVFFAFFSGNKVNKVNRTQTLNGLLIKAARKLLVFLISAMQADPIVTLIIIGLHSEICALSLLQQIYLIIKLVSHTEFLGLRLHHGLRI